MSKENPYELKILISNENNNDSKLIKKYNNEELNSFRDDILQYIKDNFQEYSTKLQLYLLRINTIEKNFEEMTNTINSNYNKIITTQANLNIQLDKLKDYESFYNKTNDKLISHEIRLNNIREDFSKATQKYDKIYLDNLELPGYIGRCAKYKNCQIFFNDVIKEMSSLNQFKEKNTLDLKSYKDKLENIIKSFNILVDNNNKSQIEYINKLNEKNVYDCQGMVDMLGEKIRELKVENAKYSMDLINKSDELSKKWNKVEEIKKDLFNEFEDKTNEFKISNDNILNKFNEFKNEYKIIRDKFFELAEFIKDIRFRKNIKNLYGEILQKKDIKNIFNKLNDINTNTHKNKKNENKQNEIKNLELLKDITSVIKMEFKISNNKIENKLEKSEEITPDKIKEYIQKNKKSFRRSVEYNSPVLFSNKNLASSIGKNDKISLVKTNNKNKEFHSDNKNMHLYSDNYNSCSSVKNQEKEEYNKNNLDNYSKRKGSHKIFINSKEENKKINKEIKKSKDKEVEKNNKSNEKIINNAIIISSNTNNLKINNNPTEESNSNIVDVQSTLANANNSINENNISISSISTFCLNNNNNNNKNPMVNDICLDTNDKVIKELASELEQSTAKKDFASSKKEEKIKINKNIIEPLNLVKTIQEEKEITGSSTMRDKTFLNSNRDNIESNKNKNNNSFCLNKLINEKDNKKNELNDNNNNEFFLYGNNPREIDKKFIMTDKKLLDLEEYTKEKIVEIIAQINKLKSTQKNEYKYNSKNNNKDVNVSMKEKNSFNSYRGILGYNDKNEKKININNNIKSNIFKGLNIKNDENINKENIINYEKNKNLLDLTYHNFHKNKLYNIEQINQKIFNSSCKKIKTCTSINDYENNFHTTKARDFSKNKISDIKDVNISEQKKSEKKNIVNNININKIKNNDLKKIKCRNNSSGNIYLTQKKGESLSFNEAEIKLVYLNKFVNHHLPYAPIEHFSGEESFNI